MMSRSPFISISSAFPSIQASRIDNFFIRLQSTPAGRVLINEIAQKTTGGIFNRVGANPIVIKPLTGSSFGEFIKERPLEIRINSSTAFSKSSTTINASGRQQTFEQIILHELIHLLLNDNKGISLSDNFNNSFSMIVAKRITDAGGRGFSQSDQNFSFEPLSSLITIESQAESLSNRFYNAIFFDVGLTNYFIRPNATFGENEFDPRSSIPFAGFGVVEKLAEDLETFSADSFSSVRSQAKASNLSLDRLLERGGVSKRNYDELKSIYSDLQRELTKQKGLKFSQTPELEEIVDSRGNLLGLRIYGVENGVETPLGSIDLIFPKDNDGNNIVLPDGTLPPPIGQRTNNLYNNSLDIFSTFKPGTRDVIAVDIKIPNNPVRIEFSDAGGILGQQLGYRLAKNNALVGVIASATLQTLGDNFGDLIDGLISGGKIGDTVKVAFSEFGDELLTNLKSAGVGAISSFLTAQLVNVLGVDGFAGELTSAAVGTVIGTIVTNIASGAALFEGLSPAAIGQAVGSVLGNKLANKVITFNSVGGQIGSALGSALAVLAASKLLGGPLGLVPATIVAFIGNIIGGAIGSLFGGTSRSGADVAWDANVGRFKVDNIYARKGGSRDQADFQRRPGRNGWDADRSGGHTIRQLRTARINLCLSSLFDAGQGGDHAKFQGQGRRDAPDRLWHFSGAD
jgi:hypothetical protein